MLNGRKQELPKQAHMQKEGLFGIVNKASEIGGRGDTDQSAGHTCAKCPSHYSLDLLTRLLESPSDAKAACFFMSV